MLCIFYCDKYIYKAFSLYQRNKLFWCLQRDDKVGATEREQREKMAAPRVYVGNLPEALPERDLVCDARVCQNCAFSLEVTPPTLFAL